MTFFRHEAICARDVRLRPDLLTRLRKGDLDAVIVHQVYDGPTCAGLVAQLESQSHGLVRTDFPEKFRAYFLGINLNLAHPELGPYFAEAARFHQGLARLFSGGPDLRARVTELLSALDQGLGYHPPDGPQPGSHYMFATIRAHLKGGYIPAHFDDEQAGRPSYRHLTPIIRRPLFSYVLAFSQAQGGGALDIFDLEAGAGGGPIAIDGRSAPLLDLSGVDRVSFRLAPGDMIIFNSGRRLHRVTPVTGDITRWTACSFMAQSLAGDRVYCWG